MLDALAAEPTIVVGRYAPMPGRKEIEGRPDTAILLDEAHQEGPPEMVVHIVAYCETAAETAPLGSFPHQHVLTAKPREGCQETPVAAYG
jgi:hypothetical protein